MRTIAQIAPAPLRRKLATGKAGSFIEKVDLALALFEGGSRAFTVIRNFWRKYFEFTVSVSEKDALYSEVHDWLIGALPEEKHHAISVATQRRSRSDYPTAESSSEDEVKPQPLVIRFNENTVRTLMVDGHKIRLMLRMPEAVTERNYMTREPEYARIEFYARSHAGQQAVVRHLDKLNAKRSTARKATLKMVGQWGSWTTRSDLPPRTMESVILPPSQKDRVVSDLRTFLAAEDQYNRLAIPWHRGYMFHGPPGTGKTSLVKALANEFNLDLWYVSLSDLKAESSLLGLLADVTPRSLLLLEDIDTMQITHDRDGAEQGKISMGSLLNTLDGVGTPHGLITIMTTNRFDVLDPALTRAGRMDMIELLDYPSYNTVLDMYRHFFKTDPGWAFEGYPDAPIEGLSTSQLAEAMKRHMNDPEAAGNAVLDILKAQG